MKIYYHAFKLPTGLAFAAATEAGITRLDLKGDNIADFASELEAEFGVAPVRSEKPFKLLLKELEAYFSGEPVIFTTRLDVTGTAFQERVWSELLKIPYGNARTYKWLAQMVGNPKAARAVGGALNKNRVPVLIPCHRVIESSGGLGGYGYGLDVKIRLLELEGILPARCQNPRSCLSASYTTTPTAVERLMLLTGPNIGIVSAFSSFFFNISSGRPLLSGPNTRKSPSLYRTSV